jgi:phosphoglycerate dehydrogenase-like enzyme
MSKPGILITARFDPALLPKLQALILQRKDQAEVVLRDWGPGKKRLEPQELAALLQGKQVLVSEIDPVNEALLSACPTLKVAISCRGNPVNLDIPACTKRGVLCLNTPGRNAEAVADLAVLFMLACARHLVPAHNTIKEGGWTRTAQGGLYWRFQGMDMEHAVAGLVGFGAVARATTKRLRSFGTRVLAFDPYVPPEKVREQGVAPADLPTLLREADFVSLHVHVTPETKHMIGAAQLALMKPTAYLINTARSGAVDQDAMVQALKDKRIAGAALDVFDQEPLPLDSPLRTLDNVVMTPHLGGATPGIVAVQSRTVLEQIEAILAGREPPHMLNKEVAAQAIKAVRGG